MEMKNCQWSSPMTPSRNLAICIRMWPKKSQARAMPARLRPGSGRRRLSASSLASQTVSSMIRGQRYRFQKLSRGLLGIKAGECMARKK